MLQIKRAYDPPSAADGPRILVDRLWPRGCTKEALHLHAWPKALTPSTDLRKAFHGGTLTFEVFAQRFRQELTLPEAQAAVDELVALARNGALTLVTAHRNLEENHALVLKAVLETRLKKGQT